MAEIGKPGAIAPLGSATGQYKRDGENKKPPKERPERPPARESVSDVTLIMGIPADEVTPKVQEAISIVMNELDHLREQLSFAHEHIDYLEKLSEEHSFLPLMSYRGLHREMTRIIGYMEHAGAANSFICLHFPNIEEIRRDFGLLAAKSVLAEAAGLIHDNLLETDITGSLGGNDVGVILTMAGAEEARKRAGELAEILRGHGFAWKGEAIRLEVAFGVHDLLAGESAEEAINAADWDLTANIKGKEGEEEKGG